jgi:sulfite exporter TauE/SafE
MCGPIALALPLVQNNLATKLVSILLYNIGRALTYGLFGVVFGLLGSGFVFFGLQQILSVTIGILILAFVIIRPRYFSKFKVTNFIYGKINGLKNIFSQLLKRRTLPALFLTGLINGLLPCGMVYVAAAASVATADWLHGALFMMMFGLGTIPAMFSVSLFSNLVGLRFRKSINKAVPYMISAMAIMMVMRGLNLGIPYLSPSANKNSVMSCHGSENCQPEKNKALPICCSKK